MPRGCRNPSPRLMHPLRAMISTLEINQLSLRYAALRNRNARRETQLVASMERVGQRVPVVVAGTGSGAVLLDGYKRVRALHQLGVDTVRAFCWSVTEDEGLIVQRMLQEGEAPSALEMGWLLVELRTQFGHSEAELAKRLCKSKSFVSRCLALAEALPANVQQWVREGRIGSWAAMKFLVPLARANPSDAQRLAEWMKTTAPSTREVAQWYAAYQGGTPQGRAWLLENPSLALRATPGKATPTAPDVLRDAETLYQTSVRLRRRTSLLKQLAGGSRELAQHHVSQALVELAAVRAVLEAPHAG